ncbi:MAG: hypothetical protein HYU67_04490 [Flavobacteriia bacterium]|nr:hypothetical protein [Flavobacteriia bacterium]
MILVNFPLLLQFRAALYNNFGIYSTGGIQYTFDLQSQAKANQSLIDSFVKIKAQDWYGLFGFGLEFYAVYFKCNIEIKYAQGFNNVFIQDFTPVSLPIESIKNKTWLFTIIFEG